MAPPLDRTWFNTLIDDDGTGTVGTIWNKTQIDGLMDTIDLSLAGLVDNAALTAKGYVDKTGTAVTGELAVFHDADTVKGGSGILAPGGGGLSRNTAAGADTEFLAIGGGGGVDISRGGYMQLFGNNNAANAAQIVAVLGNVAGGSFQVLRSPDFAQVLVVANSGVVSLPLGQLQFRVTPNPSTDPYTIDDYREQSTWLPTLIADGGASGQTYGSRAGFATKFGRLVFAEFTLTLSNKGTLTGSVMIGNLPYPSALPYAATCAINFGNLATLPTAMVGSAAWAGSQAFYLTKVMNGAVPSVTTAADITNSTVLAGTYIYHANA